MKRREFIILLGGATGLWPLAGPAQQPARPPRVGVLVAYPEGDREAQSRIVAFEQGLKDLGWTNGHNVEIIYRFGAGTAERMGNAVRNLISQSPDVLVASGGDSVGELRRATGTTPIVAAVVGDLVGLGHVQSLAHPGGNITGFTSFEYTIGGKWLQLLREVAPSVRRVMVLQVPNPSPFGSYVPSIEAAARPMNIEVIKSNLQSETDIGPTIDQFAREPNGGLIVMPGAFTGRNRNAIIAASARNRLPTAYPYPYFVEDGGLLAYGSDSREHFRRAAGYVDRILKGEKPANLPVQAPTKYELVVNLKTAKALGLEIPPTVYARADKVIE